jgi:hypothetical protein
VDGRGGVVGDRGGFEGEWFLGERHRRVKPRLSRKGMRVGLDGGISSSSIQIAT